MVDKQLIYAHRGLAGDMSVNFAAFAWCTEVGEKCFFFTVNGDSFLQRMCSFSMVARVKLVMRLVDQCVELIALSGVAVFKPVVFHHLGVFAKPVPVIVSELLEVVADLLRYERRCLTLVSSMVACVELVPL